VPFLRFSRDKRGYEHTYLVHASNRRGKPIRPRILYWYRTPPGIRLGREPFPEEVRRAIEAQNPGVIFDWKTLANTPFPSQEPEFWRERRRAEKAAKQARREEEALEAPDSADAGADDEVEPPAAAAELAGEADAAVGGAELGGADAGSADDESPAEGVSGASDLAESPPDAAQPGMDGPGPLRRRRRRGGRRRRGRSDHPEPPANGDAVPAGDAGTEEGRDEPITESAPSNTPESASEDQE
jgi:ribonuclease E